MDKWLKILGAAVLLVSLALPMGTCYRFYDAEGNRVEVADPHHPPAGLTAEVKNEYALGYFDVADWGSWSRLLAFVWPALAVAHLAWRGRGRIALGVRIAEVPLLAYSFWAVDFISTFLVDRRASGAWVAFGGLGLYAAATVWIDVLRIREWRARKRAGVGEVAA